MDLAPLRYGHDYLVRADHGRLRRSLKRTLSCIALQKPIDDGPRVRFVRTLAWCGFRRPCRLLRLRLLLRTGWFRRAPWRGCLSSRLASFGKRHGRGWSSDLVRGVEGTATRNNGDQNRERHATYVDVEASSRHCLDDAVHWPLRSRWTAPPPKERPSGLVMARPKPENKRRPGAAPNYKDPSEH